MSVEKVKDVLSNDGFTFEELHDSQFAVFYGGDYVGNVTVVDGGLELARPTFTWGKMVAALRSAGLATIEV